MSDLIERLRDADIHSQQRVLGSRIFGEAADRITSLEREVEELRGENARMRSERLYIIGFNDGWESAHEQQPGDDLPFPTTARNALRDAGGGE